MQQIAHTVTQIQIFRNFLTFHHRGWWHTSSLICKIKPDMRVTSLQCHIKTGSFQPWGSILVVRNVCPTCEHIFVAHYTLLFHRILFSPNIACALFSVSSNPIVSWALRSCSSYPIAWWLSFFVVEWTLFCIVYCYSLFSSVSLF